jgi:pimeloyl-ACP methyl ester carboxylesterase
MQPWPRVILIAESFSTPIAVQIAASAENNINGLVLCAGFAASPLRGFMRILALTLGPSLMKRRLSDSVVRTFLAGPGAPQRLVTAVRQAVASIPSQVLANRLAEVLRCDVLTEIPKIQVPIVCLRPTQDKLVGAACSKEILRLSREANLIEISGPHLILQRQPGLCAQAIVDFIQHH